MPTITKSIGTSSRDYSTITAWEADLDNGAVYASGDTALGEGYNDSVFNEGVTINGGGTIGLTTIILSVASGQRHTGVAGTGCRNVYTTAGTVLHLNVGKQIEVEWWDLSCNGTNSGGVVVSGDPTGIVTRLRNSICRNVAATNQAGPVLVSMNDRTGTGDMVCTNNIIYGITQNRVDRDVVGLGFVRTGASHDVYNNTIYNVKHINAGAGAGIDSTGMQNSGGDSRNNIVTDVTVAGAGLAECFATGASTDYNLSSDSTASGANSLTSKSASNQFVSIVGGSEDLHLKTGADAIDTGTDLGTTPTGVQFDIDNYDRDTTGVTWDIGADEFVSVGHPTIRRLSRYRSVWLPHHRPVEIGRQSGMVF